MSTEDGQALADELGCMFTETSAKVGINVKQLFKDLASKLPGVDQSRAGAAVDPQAEARAGAGGAGGADGANAASANKSAFTLGGAAGAAQQRTAQQNAPGKTNGGSKCC